MADEQWSELERTFFEKGDDLAHAEVEADVADGAGGGLGPRLRAGWQRLQRASRPALKRVTTGAHAVVPRLTHRPWVALGAVAIVASASAALWAAGKVRDPIPTAALSSSAPPPTERPAPVMPAPASPGPAEPTRTPVAAVKRAVAAPARAHKGSKRQATIKRAAARTPGPAKLPRKPRRR